eukprot:m.113799 g.113799  ORF g.113799 m.113799 type:complete len:97 (-) comp17103_c0_seq1:361-651(-)
MCWDGAMTAKLPLKCGPIAPTSPSSVERVGSGATDRITSLMIILAWHTIFSVLTESQFLLPQIDSVLHRVTSHLFYLQECWHFSQYTRRKEECRNS